MTAVLRDTAIQGLSPEQGVIRKGKSMGFVKKGDRKTRAGDTVRTAKENLGRDGEGPWELRDALKRLNNSQKLKKFVKSTDWKQRCTLLFELICQHFDGRGTAEELISLHVINYVAVEVTEDFREVFEAIQAKYSSMDLNSSVHGYLIHAQKLIKEETGFEYPDEIVYTAGTMVIGKFKDLIS